MISRVLLIYILGLAAGAQAALYLSDTFDDGVSDPLSGAIALVLLIAGIAIIIRSFRRVS